jgi:hypothetical protein
VECWSGGGGIRWVVGRDLSKSAKPALILQHTSGSILKMIYLKQLHKLSVQVLVHACSTNGDDDEMVTIEPPSSNKLSCLFKNENGNAALSTAFQQN